MTGLILVGLLFTTIFLFRRFTTARNEANSFEKDPVPRSDNAPAFVAASVQGVIQKLREEQKALERQLRLERESAQTASQFHDEILRNMPGGLLVVSSNGIIASSNPSAERALGIQSLAFRRYSEVFGETSALSQLINRCLNDGESFRNVPARHVAPDGTPHDFNVTVVASHQAPDKTKVALCLFVDVTEVVSPTPEPSES